MRNLALIAVLTGLVVPGSASAGMSFEKLAFHQPVPPDCAQKHERGVKLQTRRACTAAAEWGEWMVESDEAHSYEPPDCDRLSKTRVRCDVTVGIDGILPSGRVVDSHRFTTIASANRGCVDLRVWRWSERLTCWI